MSEQIGEEAVLYLIPTPIGNLGDITYRAIEILSQIPVLACEDTRRTIRIFDHYDLPRPKTIFSCHEHNEQTVSKRIWGFINSGISVALVSDAGSPGISDPGYQVVNYVLEQGGNIVMLPGASAVQTALVSSGLPYSSYTFKGFPPRKSGKCRRFLEMDVELPHTLVYFESPYRVHKFLVQAIEVFGNRKAAVCREMTKMFESVNRDNLENLIEYFEDRKVKGEVTIVIEGMQRKLKEIKV